MRHKRELWWWLAACAAGVGLSAWVGGLIGPMVALFVVVLLAGAILIEYEGPQAVAGAGPVVADASAAMEEAPVDDDLPADEPQPEADAANAVHEESRSRSPQDSEQKASVSA
jgi:hypothetical protein